MLSQMTPSVAMSKTSEGYKQHTLTSVLAPSGPDNIWDLKVSEECVKLLFGETSTPNMIWEGFNVPISFGSHKLTMFIFVGSGKSLGL